MNEGDAKSWKDQFLENASTTGMYDLGTWDGFQDELKKAFKPFDASEDALEKLISLKKGALWDQKGWKKQHQIGINF